MSSDPFRSDYRLIFRNISFKKRKSNQSVFQPESEPGTAGRNDCGLSWFGNCCPEVFPRYPSLPEGKGIQPLCLGGCQSGNWKVSFPHVRILKKSQQIKWKLYLWHSPLNQTVVCLRLQSDHLFAYKVKNDWNENHNFTKIFRQNNTISFLY